MNVSTSELFGGKKCKGSAVDSGAFSGDYKGQETTH